MGLNKSKKLAKKSVKPAPVIEEDDDDIEEMDEVEEVEDDDEVEEVEEVAPAKKSRRGRPAKSKAAANDDGDADDADADDDDMDISFDTDSVVKGIVSDKRNLTSAVYQVQLRLPAELEPLYKALSPRLKKALRDAFGELIRKAYNQTH